MLILSRVENFLSVWSPLEVIVKPQLQELPLHRNQNPQCDFDTVDEPEGRERVPC